MEASFFICRPMNTSETVDAQITLPSELYKAIEQHAHSHGHSVSHEIVTLLSSLLPRLSAELKQEFAEWEAASDEDWLAIESLLAPEDEET